MKIAITGSIGSGKSLASSYLRDLGYIVFDTDKMVHEYYEHGAAAYHDIVERFGQSILAADGRIDRGALANVVFQDKASLRDLEGIVYPYLIAEIEHYNEGDALVFYEAPVMFEAGLQSYFDGVLMIVIDSEIAHERLLKRGMSAEDVKRRLSNQMSPSEKEARSDYVIANNKSIEALHQAIDEILPKIIKEEHHGKI